MVETSHREPPAQDPLEGRGPAHRWLVAVWAVYGPWFLGTAGALAEMEGTQLVIAALPAAFVGMLLTPAFGDSAVGLVGGPGTLGLIWIARLLVDRNGLGLLLMAALIGLTGMYFGGALRS